MQALVSLGEEEIYLHTKFRVGKVINLIFSNITLDSRIQGEQNRTQICPFLFSSSSYSLVAAKNMTFPFYYKIYYNYSCFFCTNTRITYITLDRDQWVSVLLHTQSSQRFGVTIMDEKLWHTFIFFHGVLRKRDVSFKRRPLSSCLLYYVEVREIVLPFQHADLLVVHG